MAGDGEHELISGGHLVAKALKAKGMFNVCVDPDVHAHGTMNQTMYK